MQGHGPSKGARRATERAPLSGRDAGICEAGRGDAGLVYDLRAGEGTSDTFYRELAQFADEALARVEERAGALLDGYSEYARKVVCEAPRSRGEYVLDFLTLGMGLKTYAAAADGTPRWAIAMARSLVGLRHRTNVLKPLIDAARVALARAYFAPAGRGPAERSLEGLDRLVRWMSSTGEFEQEAQRLRNWQGFLAKHGPDGARRGMETAVGVFDNFAAHAAARLGKYTAGVEGFLAGEFARRRFREDWLFCGRDANAYYLNMVAAEAMNRGLRERFIRTSRRVVLVPACMRGARTATCKAQVDGVDRTCTACDPECAVNRITRRMQSAGAQVFLVPHTSGFGRWLRRWEQERNVGVTAVACMLNILPGGYEMRSREIASQCVLLDYPGCRKHWDQRGVATAVNEERLVQIASASRTAA